MTAPTLLRVVAPESAEPVLRIPIPLIPARAGYEHLTSRERATTPAVATREALLNRLEIAGQLSPTAPLSFLVVHICGMGQLGDLGVAERALEKIMRFITSEIGPLDLAGRYTANSFGIILQGRGVQATAALAARFQYTLNRLDEVPHPVRVDVYAATGTGLNAETLPVAAGDALPEIG